MNCIELSVTRVGRLSLNANRVGGLKIRVGLVCTTNLGEQGIIWASDGKLITLEGGYLIGA